MPPIKKLLFYAPLILGITITNIRLGYCQESTNADVQHKYLDNLRLVRSEQYDAAISGLKKIIQEDPFFYRAYRTLVVAYKEKDDLEQALRFFEQLASNDPNNALAYYGFGLVYMETDDFDQAIKQFKKCIALASEFASAYMKLTDAFQKIQKLDMAASYFNDRRTIDQDNAYANLGLGYVAYWQRNMKGAVQKWNHALESSANLEDKVLESGLHYLLGLANSRLMEDSMALNHYMSALEIVRKLGDKELEMKLLGNVSQYVSDENPRKAIGYALSELELAEEYGDRSDKFLALFSLGVSYVGISHFSEALRYYDLAYKISEEMGEKSRQGMTLGNSGSVYYLSGEYSKALEKFGLALKIAEEIDQKTQRYN
jgi:tetratricopeptide (TPR) repeat protein